MATAFSPTLSSNSTQRNWLVIGGLFVALLVVSALLSEPESRRPYELDSSEPNGLLALTLWLEELGYQVSEIGSLNFNLTADSERAADLLFVYPNAQPYSPQEATELAQWVEAGGTLILIGPNEDDAALTETFGIRPAASAGFSFSPERTWQPLLPSPPEGWGTMVGSSELDIREAPNAVTVLAANSSGVPMVNGNSGQATVAIQKLGQGHIWHLSPSHDLTNQRLERREDGYILVALLRTVPDGGSVLFDTYHLHGSVFGTTADGPQSLRGWLYGTNPGRAILFGALLLFGFLILQGIRLGPPLPNAETMLRREAAEYVVAMAGLRRRVGEPTAVADYQRRRLKQIIGRPLHIDTTLADETFVQQWQERDPHVSQQKVDEVAEILIRLSLKLNERTLVETAARIDKLINRH